MKELFNLNNREYHPYFSIFEQISQWINFYNQFHYSEMLPKSPQELEKIFRDGLSLISFDEKGNPIGHVGLYPLLDYQLGEKRLRLAELGSWIVHPDYRHLRLNGLTIGETLIKEMLQRFPDLPIIATVKRINSLKGMTREGIGGQALDFNQFSCLSALTCVCSNSSEHFGNKRCLYRRNEGNGIEKGILEINFLNPEEPKMIPCTLIGFNLPAVEQLESDLQSLIFGLERPLINPLTFARVKSFFEDNGVKII